MTTTDTLVHAVPDNVPNSVPDTLPDPVLAGPVPPARPLPLWRALRMAGENSLGLFPQAAYEQPVYAMTSFGGKFYLVNDPAGVKQVLLDKVDNYPKHPQEREALGSLFGQGILTSEGETWRSHRKIMAPAFDLRSLHAYAPVMARTTDEWTPAWDALADGVEVEVAAAMTDLTLRIISRTMFSADTGQLSALVGQTFSDAQAQLEFGLADLLPLVGKFRERARRRKIHRIFAGLDAEVARLIAQRASHRDEAPTDLLSRLVDAQDPDSGVGMTPAEVRDQVVTIFIAGHETTAVAMTWIWYLLSQHPAQEARLHAELDAVLGGRTPAYGDLARLPYTRMVIDEAMRLYPPAPALSTRQAAAPDSIAGQAIPKGAMVGVAPWVLHRQAAHWDAPGRFDPERFAPARAAGRPRYAYLPFGGGPRVCIGMAMALMEATIILATLAQRWRLRLAPGFTPEPQAKITLRAKSGLRMTLERRTAATPRARWVEMESSQP